MWWKPVRSAMAVFGLLAIAWPAAANEGVASRVIAKGEGLVEVAPELLEVVGVIRVRTADRDAALQSANAIVARLRTQTPRLAGISDVLLTMTDTNVFEEWPPGCQPNRFGHGDAPVLPPAECRILATVVQINIKVRARGVDQAGSVLSFLNEAGVGNVDLRSYIVADYTASRAQAQADAVRNALLNADALAKAAGGRVGKVIRVQPAGLVDWQDSLVDLPSTTVNLPPTRQNAPVVRARVGLDLPPPAKERVTAEVVVEVELLK